MLNEFVSFLESVAGATVILATVTVIATVSNIYFSLANANNQRRNLHLEMLKNKSLSILQGNILGGSTLFIPSFIDFNPMMFDYVDQKPNKKWWDIFSVKNAARITTKDNERFFEPVSPALYNDLSNHFPDLASRLNSFQGNVRDKTRGIYQTFNRIRKLAYLEAGLPEDFDWTESKYNNVSEEVKEQNAKKFNISRAAFMRMVDPDLSWEDFEAEYLTSLIPQGEGFSITVQRIAGRLSDIPGAQGARSDYLKMLADYNKIDDLFDQIMGQVYLEGNCGYIRPKKLIFKGN